MQKTLRGSKVGALQCELCVGVYVSEGGLPSAFWITAIIATFLSGFCVGAAIMALIQVRRRQKEERLRRSPLPSEGDATERSR